jgi:hypothetical protein
MNPVVVPFFILSMCFVVRESRAAPAPTQKQTFGSPVFVDYFSTELTPRKLTINDH